ncbi:uncharacterized protein LOC141585400 isoform X2 [Saimiri boliviensis]|uniref:uncharacterized protein LOC141585400 isoform X2 n=1 Tax=Saimiri boliviensis TaxID=27679 RepID=UPI003D76B4A4
MLSDGREKTPASESRGGDAAARGQGATVCEGEGSYSQTRFRSSPGPRRSQGSRASAPRARGRRTRRRRAARKPRQKHRDPRAASPTGRAPANSTRPSPSPPAPSPRAGGRQGDPRPHSPWPPPRARLIPAQRPRPPPARREQSDTPATARTTRRARPPDATLPALPQTKPQNCRKRRRGGDGESRRRRTGGDGDFGKLFSVSESHGAVISCDNNVFFRSTS